MEEQKEFRINNFDLLRLLAATQVIFDHYFQHLNIPIGHLWLKIMYLFPGVPIFFVISGYLISASFERNNSLRNYFRNRALRIYPGLWGCIIITLIIFSLTGVNFFNRETIAWLPSQLIGGIYTPNFLDSYGFGSYNGSLWTIPIELQFYIVLPACFFFAPKKYMNQWFWILLIVFTAGYIIFELIDFGYLINKLIRYSFIPHFFLFLTGVILQRLRIYKSKYIYGKALYWIVLYVVFSMIFFDRIDAAYFTTIQYLFLSFCILSMAYTLPRLADKLLQKNDISYGIYIYHGLILTVAVQLKLVPYINLPIVIGLTIILASLSWIFIEKPFMKRKEKTIRAVD
ncbi:acyltransferase family protein [Mucilaginibacter segetis]|uniref:Acyltransferase n=1 Tax=Mucilaginibacter segetis TaxID=2793071 RepID=A0A934UNS2_9SPHI|nr:acyltransferase [Mucilaginibacter segetis]MBK0380212.1 acyltransferase [Mucilaginibacter segetis]